MLELLAQPHNLPFAVALAVLGLIAILQLVGLAELLGIDVDGDVPGSMAIDAGLLSLIGIGRLPFLMWLMLLLGVFAIVGLSGQELLANLTGKPWPAGLAALAAGAAALPLTGIVARPLGPLVPRDETTAIDVASLVGREARLVIGTATPGNPARAQVTDYHGQTHYVMVEPANPGQRFVTDERVLLVDRVDGVFRAIARGDHYLPRLDTA